jgi:hypothetical protein
MGGILPLLFYLDLQPVRFNQPICREVNLYTQMLISSRKALTDIAQDNVGSNVSWPNQVDPEN